MRLIILAALAPALALCQITTTPPSSGGGSGPATAIASGLTAALPGTCTVGNVYLATDAVVGSNTYNCTDANTWTQQTGTTGGAIAAAQACANSTTINWACATGAGDFSGQNGYAIQLSSPYASSDGQLLNVDGYGTVNICTQNGEVISAGDVQPGFVYTLAFWTDANCWGISTEPLSLSSAPPYSFFANVTGSTVAPSFIAYGGLFTFDTNGSSGLAQPTASSTFTFPATASTGLTLSAAVPGATSASSGTNASSVFNVAGVTGGATTNNTGTGGNGSSPSIAAGNGAVGGGTNGNGGNGGNITLTAGTGGGGTGTGTVGVSGAVRVVGALNVSTLTASSLVYTDASKNLTSTAPTGQTFNTGTNCSSSASPAVCGSAAAGSVAIPTGVTSVTLTVNSSAVTANSQIFLMSDDSLGTKLSVTCNSTLATLVGGMAVTARTAATSFTITYNGTIATNPLCVSYLIIN